MRVNVVCDVHLAQLDALGRETLELDDGRVADGLRDVVVYLRTAARQGAGAGVSFGPKVAKAVRKLRVDVGQQQAREEKKAEAPREGVVAVG